jgi:hypothetical protein
MKAPLIHLGLTFLTLMACKRESEIKVYRVSKAPLEEPGPDQQSAMPANAPSPSMPDGLAASGVPRDSTAPQLKWEIPQGWQQVPPSSMRYASFTAGPDDSKIDISIVTFPGEGGSDADNVNRWRQQLQLPPMGPAGIASQVESVKGGDTVFSTVDIAGPNARTLAAWTRRDGRVWFLKATGPTTAVEKEKPNFVKFVQSVRF